MPRRDRPWPALIETNDPPTPIPFDTGADILSRPIPEPNWAIAGLCYQLDHVIVSGDGGLGKSLMAIHTALCLAAARPVFGRWPVARPHRVAYLDLEDRSESIDYRVHRVAAGLEITDPAALANFYVLRRALVLDDRSDARQLLALVRELGLEWLMVDSYSASMDGDMLSQQDVAYLHRVCTIPLREAGCGNWFVDHTRKLTGDPARDTPGESIIGARRKRNAADVHVGIEVLGEDLAWKPSKNRHGARGEALRIRLDQTDDFVRFAVVGALDTAADATSTAILAALGAGELTRDDLVAKTGRSVRTVSDALAGLVDRGLVVKRKDGKRVLNTLAPAPTK